MKFHISTGLSKHPQNTPNLSPFTPSHFVNQNTIYHIYVFKHNKKVNIVNFTPLIAHLASASFDLQYSGFPSILPSSWKKQKMAHDVDTSICIYILPCIQDSVVPLEGNQIRTNRCASISQKLSTPPSGRVSRHRASSSPTRTNTGLLRNYAGLALKKSNLVSQPL